MVWIVVALVLLPVVLLAGLRIFSRRPEGLGVQDGRLADCPSTPNCVSSGASDAGHRVEPLRYEGDPAEALRRAEAALGTLPRVSVVTRTADYLHAEAVSRLFRFVDDVELHLDPADGVIHVRSASRVGRSDLGVNRARVEALRGAFRQIP